MDDPITTGDYEKVYTVNITSFIDFERIKVGLIEIQGVEDVSLNEAVTPHEITAFTNGQVADITIQEVVAQLGFQAVPKTFLIS